MNYDEFNAPSIEGAIAEIRTQREKKIAKVRLAPSFWEQPRADQAHHLRHEMVHLLLDSLWEEHEMQIQSSSIPHTQKTEYRERFRRELEKVVEHIACTYRVDTEERIM